MFTDIVGSTEMTARLGDSAALELVRAHDALVRRGLGLPGGGPSPCKPVSDFWWLVGRGKFPGINQFIREPAGFRAFGRLLTLRKPLSSRVNLNPAA